VSNSEQLEQLMAQYRKQFEELSEIQHKLREISCTVTAPRQAVTVTVGHGGAVTDIKFPTGAYKRMPPAELAKAVLKAITDAQQQVSREAAEVVAPSLPAGIDAQELFSGKADLQSLLSPEPELQDSVRDIMRMRD